MGSEPRGHKITLTIEGRKSTESIDKDVFCVGRSQDADIVIAKDVVSKRHIEITVKNGHASIRDLGSRNGTSIDGMALQADIDYPVHRDSEIFVGDPSVVIRIEAVKSKAVAPASASKSRVNETEGKISRVLASLSIAEGELARVKKELDEETGRLEEMRRSAKEETDELRRLAREETERAERRLADVDHRASQLADREHEFESARETAEAELDSMKQLTASLGADAEQLVANVEESRAAVKTAREELRELASQTEGALAKHAGEIASHEEREKKLRARIEMLEAEAKVTRLRIDGENEKLASLKRATEDEIRITDLRKQKEELDTSMATQRAEKALALILEKTQLSIAESEKALKGLEETKAARAKLDAEVDSLRRDVIRSEEILEKTRASTQELKTKTAAEADVLLKTARETEEKSRAASAELGRSAQDAATKLVEKARESAAQTLEKARLDAATLARNGNDKLARELAEQTRHTETALANLRLEAMEGIERMKDREHRVSLENRQLQADSVVRRAIELAVGGKLAQNSNDLRGFVLQILDGKVPEISTIAAENLNRVFWRRARIAAAACAVPVLLYLAFPHAPHEIGQAVQRTIANSKNDGGAFVEQIRQKGAAYKWPKTREIRNSYVENVLFYDGYVELKQDEARQRQWTFELKTFVSKSLALDDRIIVELIASEAVLIKDLAAIRDGAVEQYKEQARKRMEDTERNGAATMRVLLRTEENYAKFRAFERSFVSTARTD